MVYSPYAYETHYLLCSATPLPLLLNFDLTRDSNTVGAFDYFADHDTPPRKTKGWFTRL